MHRQIAGKLTGRVTKWIVLGFWLIAFVGLGSFSAKLADVQNNEASSWLPGYAPSRPRRSRSSSRSRTPTPSPPSSSTSGRPASPRTTSPRSTPRWPSSRPWTASRARSCGPVPSEDGQVAQTVVTFNFGKNGWEDMPDTADELRDIAAIDGVNTYIAGSGGQAADSFEAFAGIDSTLLWRPLGVVIIILLFTYRSPAAVDPADPLGRRRLGHRAWASSTSSPSTPTSRSTARARRS